MSTLADIRAGLRANLAAAGFTNVNLYTTSNPTPPCFELDLAADGETYDLAMARGVDTYALVVRAVFAESEGAYVSLDALIDGSAPTDVKTALEADTTLGGAAAALHVTGLQPRRWKSETTGGLLVGAEWAVTVWGTN